MYDRPIAIRSPLTSLIRSEDWVLKSPQEMKSVGCCSSGSGYFSPYFSSCAPLMGSRRIERNGSVERGLICDSGNPRQTSVSSTKWTYANLG